MPLEIVFILERVLPVSRLPDAATFFALSRIADLFFEAANRQTRTAVRSHQRQETLSQAKPDLRN